MLERADVVLAAVPLLAASGIALRTAIAATGVATGLLAIPLAPAGYLAALALVVRELVASPLADAASDNDRP